MGPGSPPDVETLTVSLAGGRLELGSGLSGAEQLSWAEISCAEWSPVVSLG